MPASQLSDDAFVGVWQKAGGSPIAVSRMIGISVRNVVARRKRMMNRGIYLKTVSSQPGTQITADRYGYGAETNAYTPLAYETVKDGSVLVFSDAHYWPGEKSLAHEALCIVAKEIQPKLIIGNGDLFDGASISRHDVLGWQKLPTVAEELDAVRLRLDEIRRAAPKAKRRATVGNHDSRMDRRLATECPQFQDVHGMSLEDQIKDWEWSYAVLINEDIDPAFIVHNIRGGAYAPGNNVMAAGCHVVTGHLHSQKTIPKTFLMGKTYEGIDAGCLADPSSPSFSYLMSRPTDWRSGFVELQFDKLGRMLPANLCRVQQYKNYQRAVFRGRIVAERNHKEAA